MEPNGVSEKQVISGMNSIKNTMPLFKERQEKKGFAEAMSLYRAKAYALAAPLFESMIGTGTLEGHLVKFYHSRSCRLEAERLCGEKNYVEAVQWLRRAMQFSPQSVTLIDFLAKCYVQQENYPQAGQWFHRLTELTPADSQGILREAMSYFLTGNARKAVKILQKALTEQSNNYELNYAIGMILSADDQSMKAIPFLTQACRMRPESVDAQWKLGLAYGLAGQWIEAIHHLTMAHHLEPENHWLLAQLSLAAGQARHQGVEIDIETLSIPESTADADQESLDQLAELIVRDSDFVTAFLELPGTDIDPQIFSSLLEIIMRAIERHPEYADLHYHCSCVYDRLGESDQAIRESQNALAINPQYMNAMIHLAKLYMRTSRNEEAITRLQGAISLGANYADVHYLLGKLYHRKGSLNEAKRHYEEALKINHNFRAAAEALALMAV
jgi:tetratricopeptide (TPR) repeat protein